MYRISYTFIIFIMAAGLIWTSCSDDDTAAVQNDPVIDEEQPADVGVDAATNVVGADVNNNRNASDLQITFTKAADEINIDEYRIIVVKFAAAGSMTLEVAAALAEGRYTAVAPTGSDITILLSAGALDADGDQIAEETSYRILVLSVADGVNATLNALSAPSRETLLRSVADAASNLTLTDIGDNNDGSDMRVTFERAEREETISEYRVYIVKETQVDVFDLAAAEALGSDRYVVAPKTGNDINVALDASTTDSDGDPIGADIPYRAFALSVADGVIAAFNALSPSSNALTLTDTKLEITYMGNDGILITDGEKSVIIDALHRMTPSSGWITLPPQDLARLESAEPPYDRINLVLVTHAHGDHFHSSSVSEHLNANPNATLIAPPQALGGLPNSPQILRLNPGLHERESHTVNGIDIEVLHLHHFDQFDFDFSDVQNFGYIVNLGGMKMLHLGDVEYTVENFEGFDLQNEGIDVVFIPTFNTLISPENRDVLMQMINPKMIVALHLRLQSMQIEIDQTLSVYPDAVIFTDPLNDKISF